MYTKESLIKYDFFKSLINKIDVSYILDSLTKTVSRQYFIDFVNDLIENKVPFTMAILDLDNFKQINDNHGHLVGDQVLKEVASSLVKAIGDDGLVGRYGGDEFIFIYTKSSNYDDIHAFFSSLFLQGNVLRKNIECQTCHPFITGTIGSACYPKDAHSFKELFEMSDKTLYRGKVKGRNCFVIYVEEKHKNITVQKLAREDLYISFYNLATAFERPNNFYEKLSNAFLYLVDILKFDSMYYFDKTGAVYDIKTSKTVALKSDDFKKVIGDDILYTSNFSTETDLKDDEVINSLPFIKIQSALVIRIEKNNHFYGYILVTEVNNNRIWQSEEKAIIFYFSKMIAAYLEYKK